MTLPPDAEVFLASHTRTMLVTLRADGSPTIHPMLGMWSDGALWFNTYRKSVKVRNIERDPRVCCMVLSGTDELELPAVVIRGDAEIMPPGTTMPRLGAGAPVTAPTGVTGGIVQKVATRIEENRRILLRVAPRHAELRA